MKEQHSSIVIAPAACPKGTPTNLSIRVHVALRDPRLTYRFESIDRSSPKGSPIDFSIRVDRSIEPQGIPDRLIDSSRSIDRALRDPRSTFRFESIDRALSDPTAAGRRRQAAEPPPDSRQAAAPPADRPPRRRPSAKGRGRIAHASTFLGTVTLWQVFAGMEKLCAGSDNVCAET